MVPSQPTATAPIFVSNKIVRYSDQIVRSKLKSCDNTSSSRATREFALREHRNPTSDDTLDIGEGGMRSGISRITCAGLPTAIELAGMSRVTTEPAPIMEFEPIVTPGVTVTFAPNHTLSPIVTGEACSSQPVALPHPRHDSAWQWYNAGRSGNPRQALHIRRRTP